MFHFKMDSIVETKHLKNFQINLIRGIDSILKAFTLISYGNGILKIYFNIRWNQASIH